MARLLDQNRRLTNRPPLSIAPIVLARLDSADDPSEDPPPPHPDSIKAVQAQNTFSTALYVAFIEHVIPDAQSADYTRLSSKLWLGYVFELVRSRIGIATADG